MTVLEFFDLRNTCEIPECPDCAVTRAVLASATAVLPTLEATCAAVDQAADSGDDSEVIRHAVQLERWIERTFAAGITIAIFAAMNRERVYSQAAVVSIIARAFSNAVRYTGLEIPITLFGVRLDVTGARATLEIPEHAAPFVPRLPNRWELN